MACRQGDERPQSMTLQFSHTVLSQFDNCPEAMRQLYIVKEFKKVYTPAISGGIDTHDAIDKYLKRQAPLPADLARAQPFVASFEKLGNVESEVSFGVDREWRPADFWTAHLRGKFDVIARVPEKRRAVIGDWKDGNVREKPDQLEIGAALLMANDPTIDEVIGFNIWLKVGQLGTKYTFKRGDGATAKLTRKMWNIETLDPKVEWGKRQSGLCGYCPVKSCEHYKGA